MNVRKWVEAQALKAKRCAISPDCPHSVVELCIADAFSPAITKLVEALGVCAVGIHMLDETRDHADNYEECTDHHCVAARAALAEFEKE